MSFISRRTVAVLATTLVGAALALPGAASARTVTFKMTEYASKPAAPPDFVVKSADCKVRGTLGRGRCHSRTTPPTSKGGWKFSNGTISYVFKTTLTGTVASGRGHFTGGTGKYRGIRGTFTVRGDITGKFPFVFKGTARY